MNFDLVIAGVGGQGVLSIAWVLDHAAHAAGLRLKQSEGHGMAQRGGAVAACVRLSSEPIASDLIAAGSESAARAAMIVPNVTTTVPTSTAPATCRCRPGAKGSRTSRRRR